MERAGSALRLRASQGVVGVTIVKRGDSFGVMVYDRSVKRKVWVGTRSTEEAAKELEAREAASRKAKPGPEKADSFALRWPQDWARPAPRTNKTNAASVKPFVRDFKGRLLTSIDRQEAYQWSQGQPVGTTDAVRQMFTDAINAGLHPGPNPFANLRRHRSPGRRDDKIISEDELWSLADCACDAWPINEYGRLVFRPMILFAAYTSIRPAELYYVERTDVSGYTVKIYDADDGAGGVKRPKSGDPRIATLFPPAAEAIAAVPARLDVPWLFYTQTGKQFNKSTLYYYWNPVRILFGRPDLDFYHLRHWGGSYLTNELDVGLLAGSLQLGHKDGGLRMARLYGHPEEKLAHEKRLEAFWEKHPRGFRR